MPTEVKVLGWRKGERKAMVVKGCWRPWARGRRRHCANRRVPWSAKAEYAFGAGYDGMGAGVSDPRDGAGLLRHAERDERVAA